MYRWVLLSLALHALGAVALAPLPRAAMVGHLQQDGEMAMVTLEPLELSVPVIDAPPPEALPVATPTLAAAPRSAQRPVRRARKPPPSQALARPPAPVLAVRAPLPSATPVAPATAAPSLQAAPSTAPLAPPRPSEPTQVGPGVAAALRVYDAFPRLPHPLRGPGAHHLLVANVCVSERGTVYRVRISAPPGTSELERVLREAIGTWRYRPLTVNGTPIPFCHMLQLRYQLD